MAFTKTGEATRAGDSTDLQCVNCIPQWGLQQASAGLRYRLVRPAPVTTSAGDGSWWRVSTAALLSVTFYAAPDATVFNSSDLVTVML